MLGYQGVARGRLMGRESAGEDRGRRIRRKTRNMFIMDGAVFISVARCGIKERRMCRMCGMRVLDSGINRGRLGTSECSIFGKSEMGGIGRTLVFFDFLT